MADAVKKRRRKARVDVKHCVACGCCAKACPVRAMEIYCGVYAQVNQTKCIGCGKCAKECPASVIQIVEVNA